MSRTIQFQGYDSTELVNVETGAFSRKRNGKYFVHESKTWTCTGAIVVNNFGNVVRRLSVEELFNELQTNKSALFYKNGEAKFLLTDIDHGTRRICGRRYKHFEVYSLYKKEA